MVYKTLLLKLFGCEEKQLTVKMTLVLRNHVLKITSFNFTPEKNKHVCK